LQISLRQKINLVPFRWGFSLGRCSIKVWIAVITNISVRSLLIIVAFTFTTANPDNYTLDLGTVLILIVFAVDLLQLPN
jgi:hypothetical protein